MFTGVSGSACFSPALLLSGAGSAVLEVPALSGKWRIIQADRGVTVEQLNCAQGCPILRD